MKILFLDIDGVLTTRRSMGPDSSAFDPLAVEQLNRVLKAIPDLQLVISSTWRLLHTMEELKAIFSQYGVTSGRIIGKTPNLKNKMRGHEIQEWLDLMDGWHQGESISFAIVDDDSDMDHLMEFLYCTSFEAGLTKEVADDIIKHFGGHV